MTPGRKPQAERRRRPVTAGRGDDESVKLSRRHWSTLRYLMPMVWPRGEIELQARVIIAVLAMLAAKGMTVIVPFFYKGAVDAFSAEGEAAAALSVPLFLILGYGATRFLGNALQQFRDAVFVKVGQFAQRRVSVETFRHLHALSLRFHLDRRTGGLSRIIERGTNAIDFLFRWLIFNIVPTLVELALVCIILASLFSWTYSAVTALTVIAYMVFTFSITEWRTKFYREMVSRDAETGTKSVDSLLNFETVKYFNNEEHEARRFETSARAYADAAVKSASTLSLLNIGQTLIITAGMTLLMVMAGYGIAAGKMTVGDFVLINTYLLQIAVPLNVLGFAYREIKQALVDMERMVALKDIDQEIKDKPGAPPLKIGAGEIVFDHVSFHYDAARPILKDVSFRVPPGATYAVVGASGAGKSTLSRLLFRFYDVTAGRILIDGQDIRDVTQTSLRAAIGIVPQDTVLFNDTIRYNIEYGRPGAEEADILEAARIAQVHDFIAALPDGYEARVGERGLKLSGGEKQRVAIARTVLKAPPILVLDEATSALDSHTERAIQSALDIVSRGRTTLTIAHRLSTIVTADQILVMKEGEIAERGRHAELLALDGLYASLWRRQQEILRAQETLAAAGEEIVPETAAAAQ